MEDDIDWKVAFRATLECHTDVLMMMYENIRTDIVRQTGDCYMFCDSVDGIERKYMLVFGCNLADLEYRIPRRLSGKIRQAPIETVLDLILEELATDTNERILHLRTGFEGAKSVVLRLRRGRMSSFGFVLFPTTSGREYYHLVFDLVAEFGRPIRPMPSHEQIRRYVLNHKITL